MKRKHLKEGKIYTGKPYKKTGIVPVRKIIKFQEECFGYSGGGTVDRDNVLYKVIDGYGEGRQYMMTAKRFAQWAVSTICNER